jgi:hypothetical protein
MSPVRKFSISENKLPSNPNKKQLAEVANLLFGASRALDTSNHHNREMIQHYSASRGKIYGSLASPYRSIDRKKVESKLDHAPDARTTKGREDYDKLSSKKKRELAHAAAASQIMKGHHEGCIYHAKQQEKAEAQFNHCIDQLEAD